MNRSPARPALSWRKASYSGGGSDSCVEMADAGPVIAVRDSKNPDGPRFAFSRREMSALAARIKAGQLDL